jgi:hypothetical protein
MDPFPTGATLINSLVEGGATIKKVLDEEWSFKFKYKFIK